MLIFWAEVKAVPVPWTVVDLALEEVGYDDRLEEPLGAGNYTRETAVPRKPAPMKCPAWRGV